VVPVLIIDDAESAVPLARALVKGGLKAIEVTLRTAAALEAIRRVAGEVEGAVPGVGTVLTAGQLAAARKAGARFAVSPGGAPGVFDAADDSDVPLLPGAATAGEVMTALERGYRFQKFFPAEQAGGAAYIGALASPLQAVRFCPTGGVNAKNAPDYLKLGNVICVGGSWVAPKDKVAAGDWDAITALARDAAALGR
jgi:2-dehydro-3-deoxyphosphogluconate aldolase/(4S)-4-hydroxy-2-oxoglutarate aldolase